MMFGLDELFSYIECSKCGCLQIKEIPENMSKYYHNEEYYSFSNEKYYSFVNLKNEIISLIKTMLNKRDEYCLFKNNFLGKLINFKYPNDLFSIMGNLNIDIHSKILDIGCGAGGFLFHLKELNFKDLTGIDLYLEKEVHKKNLKIFKKNIHQLPDIPKFDFIFLNHSFEHMEDPFETLNKIKEILSEDGVCIIRIPVKTEYIWNQYGINWVQIDAPRHFFVYTEESFDILTRKTGFYIQNTIYDSTYLQFAGSERYKMGIPLNKNAKIFTQKQMNKFKKCAKKLNEKKMGDQAIFVLKRR